MPVQVHPSRVTCMGLGDPIPPTHPSRPLSPRTLHMVRHRLPLGQLQWALNRHPGTTWRGLPIPPPLQGLCLSAPRPWVTINHILRSHKLAATPAAHTTAKQVRCQLKCIHPSPRLFLGSKLFQALHWSNTSRSLPAQSLHPAMDHGNSHTPIQSQLKAMQGGMGKEANRILEQGNRIHLSTRSRQQACTMNGNGWKKLT